jgi:hypothetical protein
MPTWTIGRWRRDATLLNLDAMQCNAMQRIKAKVEEKRQQQQRCDALILLLQIPILAFFPAVMRLRIVPLSHIVLKVETIVLQLQ